MRAGGNRMYRVSAHLNHLAAALLVGALLGTLHANLDPASYYDLIETRLGGLELPDLLSPTRAPLTPFWLVGEALMALFAFYLAKELWEAHRLERGPLRGMRATLPLLATLGGMAGAALIWLALGQTVGHADMAPSATGWLVPLGSEVLLAWVAGRAVFGAGHPALHLLLLIGIGSNLAGLALLGVFHPAASVRLLWLALPVLAAGTVWLTHGRHALAMSERAHRRATRLWPYVLAGLVSWLGVVAAGLPGALGLLPVLPVIPHSHRAFGVFAEAEAFLSDPLNRLVRAMFWPLMATLLAYGYLRGGLDLKAYEAPTLMTLGALWLGKPLGLLLGVVIAVTALRQPFPRGLLAGDMVWLAGLSSLGFTMPLLAIDTALPGGMMAEAARLGAGISLIAGPVLVVMASVLRR